MSLDRICPENVDAWFNAANRAFELLRSIMVRTEEWGLREHGANPYLGIAKNPKIGRFLAAQPGVAGVPRVTGRARRKGTTSRPLPPELDNRYEPQPHPVQMRG